MPSRSLKILPLTPERWPDLEAIFAGKGCSIARQCWCMAYRRSGTHPTPPGMKRSAFNKSQLRAVVDEGGVPGLIAYRGKTPVGWLSLGPREDYRRLARSSIMGPVDDKPVWSVICFVVPQEYRGQGVARALLEGGIAYAKKNGARLVEAYPVDRRGKLKDDWLWFGTKSMYDHAGFEEVARRKPTRPVVRLKVR
jgi:GNAT superfamily N-acetyltransferase